MWTAKTANKRRTRLVFSNRFVNCIYPKWILDRNVQTDLIVVSMCISEQMDELRKNKGKTTRYKWHDRRFTLYISNIFSYEILTNFYNSWNLHSSFGCPMEWWSRWGFYPECMYYKTKHWEFIINVHVKHCILSFFQSNSNALFWSNYFWRLSYVLSATNRYFKLQADSAWCIFGCTKYPMCSDFITVVKFYLPRKRQNLNFAPSTRRRHSWDDFKYLQVRSNVKFPTN